MDSTARERRLARLEAQAELVGQELATLVALIAEERELERSAQAPHTSSPAPPSMAIDTRALRRSLPPASPRPSLPPDTAQRRGKPSTPPKGKRQAPKR